MSSRTYSGTETVEYPSLGIVAEPGQSYELPDDVETPADGRWGPVAAVSAPPELAQEAPAPIPGAVGPSPEHVDAETAPEPDPTPAPPTIGD